MLSFLFTAERCKRPLYITRITPNSMILSKNYLFEKMQVFAFHKFIAICRILMSEALYTMDILANRIALLPYQPKCSGFCTEN